MCGSRPWGPGTKDSQLVGRATSRRLLCLHKRSSVGCLCNVCPAPAVSPIRSWAGEAAPSPVPAPESPPPPAPPPRALPPRQQHGRPCLARPPTRGEVAHKDVEVVGHLLLLLLLEGPVHTRLLPKQHRLVHLVQRCLSAGGVCGAGAAAGRWQRRGGGERLLQPVHPYRPSRCLWKGWWSCSRPGAHSCSPALNLSTLGARSDGPNSVWPTLPSGTPPG